MMQMKCVAAATLLLAMTPALAQVPAAAPHALNLDFKADVQLDGTLANVEPDASLAPTLQAMVRTRVAEWRSDVSRWPGKPESQRISQRIMVEALPVSTGGFALRIKEVGGGVMPDPSNPQPGDMRMFPPDYPIEARRRGVTGTLIYAVRIDAQGKPKEITLLSPEKPDRWMKMLGQAAQDAITKWTLAVISVAGTPVECVTVVPIEFALGNKPEPDTTDLASYRARYADACPAAPKLLTEVAGTLL